MVSDMKQGTVIRLLENIDCFSPKDYKLEKYEVVQVIDENNDHILVKNIIDEYALIPQNSLYKILKVNKPKLTVNQIDTLWKDLKKGQNISNPVTITASDIQVNRKLDKIQKKVTENSLPNRYLARSVQKVQIIVSNMMSTDNIIESNRLLLASICANMCALPNLNTNQCSKLLMLCNKLLTSSMNSNS